MGGVAYIADRELTKRASEYCLTKKIYTQIEKNFDKKTGLERPSPYYLKTKGKRAKRFKATLKKDGAVYTHRVIQIAEMPDLEGADYHDKEVPRLWDTHDPEDLVHVFEWTDR